MTEYHDHGVTLSQGQVKKMLSAHNKGIGVTLKLTRENKQGTHKLPLTQTQINSIKKSRNGVQLNLSESQLKHMEKTGGFLPLAALIPIIAGAIGAAGGLTGGIASAVSAAKSNTEQARHNKAIEDLTRTELSKTTGSGIRCQKLLNKCECAMKKNGFGLYFGPPRQAGSGVFLGPPMV